MAAGDLHLPLRLISVVCGLAALALSAGCEYAQLAGLSLDGLQGEGVRSFVGVRFGASMFEVEQRFPKGFLEASPNGHESYRVLSVDSNGVTYEKVIFEFDRDEGMQFTFAVFPASARREVLRRLLQNLGPPSACSNNNCRILDAERVNTKWQLGETSTVSFFGPSRNLIMIGENGARLAPDAEMLQQRGD
jgi:hypothetical protein